MAGVRMLFGPFHYLGDLLTDGKLYHYASGTTTLRNVYTDLLLTTTDDQPVLSDANGVFTFFADDSALYKFVLKDANDAVISTWDEWRVGYVLPATVVDVATGTIGFDLISDGTTEVWAPPPLTEEPILNGNMIVAQRGASFAAIANQAYSLDRWEYTKVGTMVHTVTRDPTFPTVANSIGYLNWSLKLDLTTADVVLGAGDYCAIGQKIEAYRCHPLFSQAWVLSFWVYATKTGTHCVSIRNSGLDKSFVGEYTINTTLTWEYKTIAVSALDILTGTFDVVNGIGYTISWAQAVGTTFHASTPEVWSSGNYLATSAQVNDCDNIANDFNVTAVQIDLGTVARPLRVQDFTTMLNECQRYYQKSYDYSTAPGTASTTIGAALFRAHTTTHHHVIDFIRPMRAIPTMVAYNSSSGATGSWRDDTAAADRTVSFSGTSEKRTTGLAASSVDTNQMRAHWTAAAEL